MNAISILRKGAPTHWQMTKRNPFIIDCFSAVQELSPDVGSHAWRARTARHRLLLSHSVFFQIALAFWYSNRSGRKKEALCIGIRSLCQSLWQAAFMLSLFFRHSFILRGFSALWTEQFTQCSPSVLLNSIRAGWTLNGWNVVVKLCKPPRIRWFGHYCAKSVFKLNK